VKKLLFYFISIVLIPILIIGSLEAGLRLVGYGYNPHLLIHCQGPNYNFWRDNPEFTVPFFSKSFARSALPINVPYTKAQGAYRIFVLGESACAGYPIPEFSFSRILSVMLNDSFPDINIEVINVSNVAINSHVILTMTKELLQYKPDMLIVYMGNNEVIGPYGPGTVFAPFGANRFLIRAGIYLNQTRIGQLIKSIIDNFSRRSQLQRKWDGLAMFVHNHITAHDRRMKRVYQFFEQNLNDILTCSHKAGVKTIVSTVGTNLKDFAPFASEHDRPVLGQWNALYKAGMENETAGQYEKAIDNYQLASKIDDSYAELYFHLGRCYQALGRYDLAKGNYVKARDLDALRLRADSKINGLIHQIANERKADGVGFVDGAEILNANSPFYMSGEEFFFEHVHLTFDGNYVLAKAILEEVERQLPTGIVRTRKRNGSVLSQEQCAKRLGYTQLEKLIGVKDVLTTLVNRPPFNGVMNQQEIIDHLKVSLESLELYFKENGYDVEIQELTEALKSNPQDPYVYYHLGRAFLLLGKSQEASVFLQYAIEQLPSLKDAHRLLDLANRGILSTRGSIPLKKYL